MNVPYRVDFLLNMARIRFILGLLCFCLLHLFLFFRFVRESTFLETYKYVFLNKENKQACARPFPSWCKSMISIPCKTKHHPAAHYHKLVDCLIPEYATLKQAVKLFGTSTCVVGCGKRCVYLEQLMLLNQSNKESRFFTEQGSYCFDSRSHINITELGNHYNIREYKRSASQLRADMESVFRANQSQHNVLVVSRQETRSFAPETLSVLVGLIRTAVQPFGGSVDVYYGNETVKKTMLLYRNAAAVVMFHGAAASNMIFCREHAIFFEISTYTDKTSEVKWRSNTNTLLPIRPDIVSIVHYMPVHEILAETTIAELEDSENRDQFIKSIRNITLSVEFCTRVSVELKAALHQRTKTESSSLQMRNHASKTQS